MEFKPNQSNGHLVDIMKKELNALGFSVKESDNHSEVVKGTMKFFISRSRCGDYHFYRLDSNNTWSHKFGFEPPSNLTFSGDKITLPEYACSTDISVGYFLLSLTKQ